MIREYLSTAVQWLSNGLIVAILILLLYFLIFDRYTLQIAQRNVFRNVRRSVITIGAIALGTLTIIVFGGFINDMYYGLRESTIRSQLGHLQIYRDGYSENGIKNPDSYHLDNFEDIIRVLEEDSLLRDELEAVIPVVEFSGLISTGNNSKSFLATAVDVSKDRYFSTYDIAVSGSKLVEGDRGQATLGSLLAESLNVVPGDLLMLLVSTQRVGLNVLDVEVKGTTRSFSEEYDKVYIKMPIEDAWSLLDERYADKLIVMLNDTDHLPLVLSRLDELKAQYNLDIEYRSWKDLATFYNSVKQMYDGIFNFVKLVISIIIIVFISNTLFMSVMERVNETGSIRTIGTRRRMVMINFIIEGILLGVIGGILGIFLSWITAWSVNQIGIPMAPPPGSSQGYTAGLRYGREGIPYFIFSLKLSVITALLASLLPARKAVRMSIVDALRHY